MRHSYYLDKPDSEKSSLMLNISLRGKRLRIGTGIIIEPRHWNSDKQEPRVSDPLRNYNRNRLQAIDNAVHKACNDFKLDSKESLVTEESVQSFKQQIQDFIDPPKIEAQRKHSLLEDFTAFADTYTLRSSSGMVTANRPTERTIQFYRKVITSLSDWSEQKRKQLTYSSIDEEFYQDYYAWLSNDGKLTDSTVSNYIKVLKTFMKWAKQKGYHNTNAYESFYRDSRNGETIALTIDEIRKISDIDLSDSPRLSRVRDHFLLQCYTGMRYGDLLKLEPKHFDEVAQVIRFATNKNDTDCIVPITSPLEKLLGKYPSRLFEFASDVKQNMYLKELGQRLGFNQPMVVSRYAGGKRVEQTVKRYELLTTHVARRSFATTCLRFGIPEAVIAVMTGHSQKGMLQRHYFKLDEEAIREIVVKAWEKL